MVDTAVKIGDVATYSTIAHEFLESEGMAIGDLNTLLKEAAAKIKIEKYTKETVPHVLRTIEDLLTEPSIEKRGSLIFLNGFQREKPIFSALGPLAYMAIAEALELPFAAADRGYVLVSWQLPDGKYVNYAMHKTENRSKENPFIIIAIPKEDDDAPKGLGKNETLATYYNDIGIVWARKKDTFRAIACFDKAIKLDPTSANAYYNRSVAYHKIGEKEKAIDDACMAFELQ